MPHVRLLGAFEVVGPDGAPLDLGPPQQRALLALLALWSPSTAAVDEIIDALWHAAPPSTARNLVQVYVSRLRRILDALAGIELVTRPPGYALEIRPDSVDARRFERMTADARQIARPGERAARLGEALALWRGPALADLGRFDFLGPEITRLSELRLDTEEALLAAQLESGRHVEIIGELERFIAAHPLREGAWVLLIQALYRSGRQAEALRAYDRIRELLLNELGVDPVPELQELQHAILVHDPGLAAVSMPERAVADVVAALPSAQPGIRPGSASFRGRDEPAAAIASEYRRAEGGGVHLALVSGEAGIGKSRLVAEAARRCAGEGALVLAGGSREGSAAPFEPIVLALGPLVTVAPEDVGRLCGAGRPALARLLPALGPSPDPPAEAEAERFALLEATDELLSALGAHRPVVLVLDDLHWVDAPTVLLLRHLTLSSRDHRLLVLGAYRDDEVAEGHPLQRLLGDVRRHQVGEIITLHGLEHDAFVALVAELSGDRDIGDPDTLYRRTAGNPLFAEYLLEQSSAELPYGITDLIGSRLQRLDSEVRRILQVAAVIGQEFGTEVLASAAQVERMELLEGIDAALRDRVVVEADRPAAFAFRHALIREALVGQLSTARAAVLNWRVGEALAERLDQGDASRGDVARHLAAGAAAGDPALAIASALEAGDEAMSKLAYETAHDHFATARELGDRFGASPDVRWAVLTRLGRAEQVLGHERAWRRAFSQAADLARDNGWSARLVEAALGFAYLPRITPGRVDRRLLALVDEALVHAHAHSSARFRLMSVRTQQLLAGGEWQTAHTLLDQTLSDARSVGDEHAVIGPLEARAYSWLGGPDPTSLVADALELLGAADRVGDVAARTRALVAVAVGRLQLGDRPAFERLVDQLYETGRHRRSFEAMVLAATLAAAEGDLDRADELVTRAAAAGSDDTARMLATGVQSGFNLPIERGRLAEAAENARLFVEFMPELPAAVAVAGAMAWLTGDDEEARRAVEQLLGEAGDRLPQDWTRPLVLTQLTGPVVGLGDERRAAVLAEHLRPYSGQLLVTGDGVGIEGAADRFLATLRCGAGVDDRTAGLFLAAIRLEERLGLTAHVARSRLAYARALLRAGEVAEPGSGPGGRPEASERADRVAALLDETITDADRLGLVRSASTARALRAGNLAVR